jgi:dephospho-CoA kinase
MSGPFILGLTGSIGMGKSTVAGMFEELGIPVFHADAVVRSMQGPGGSLVPAIEAAFPGTTGPEGIDRAKVRAARRQFLREHSDAGLVVLDIPLLFERGGVEEVEAVLVVSAPAELQRERVLRRPGMTAERFEHILALQLPDAEKRARADYLIDTRGPLDETRAQVARLVEKLTG